MKKAILSVCTAIILLIAGCSHNAVPLSGGTYIAYEHCEDEVLCPYIGIDTERNTFTQGASLATSYAVFGSIKINGDKLIATAHDSKDSMVFRIDGDTLVFDAKASTAAPISMISSVPFEDGMVFSPMPKQ